MQSTDLKNQKVEDFTPEYFAQEICAFRDLFGTKGVPIKTIDAAAESLVYTYCHTKANSPKEQIMISEWLDSTLIEWERRKAHMLLLR